MSAATIATSDAAASGPGGSGADGGGPPSIVARTTPMMGGRVGVYIETGDGDGAEAAATAAEATLRRLEAWAARLTRFAPGSELSRLNAAPVSRVRVGPTLTAVLDWARLAEVMSDGVVDVAMLDERLRAEGLLPEAGPDQGRGSRPDEASRAWSLERRMRGADVLRPIGVRLDLDGVAKGWLADRGLAGLAGHPTALVDADGDIAASVGPGGSWPVAVADPRGDESVLACIVLRAQASGRARYGLATSGTSVHRWPSPGGSRHHLIDSRTRQPAATDVVQATVLAGTAREAEVLAKTAVILGADAAVGALDRPGVLAFVLLTDRDELVLGPTTREWLA